jgi:hypothetical protein
MISECEPVGAKINVRGNQITMTKPAPVNQKCNMTCPGTEPEQPQSKGDDFIYYIKSLFSEVQMSLWIPLSFSEKIAFRTQ